MKFGKWDISIKFVPRDLWLGAYWDISQKPLDRISICRLSTRHFRLFICLVPMFPIVIRRKLFSRWEAVCSKMPIR